MSSSLSRHFLLPAAAVLALLLAACGEEASERQAPEAKARTTYAGDVEVVNSCGLPNAAASMREYLRKSGFDVVSMRNDLFQNHDETIVAIRTPDWEGATALANSLHTGNLLYIKNSRAYVDATVFIGKDFAELIQQDSL